MENSNNIEKIALVTDSSCDLPKEIIQKYSIRTIPLRVIYSEGEYADGVDIHSEDVYARLEQEVPKTSLPSTSDAINVFKKLREEGYKKVFSIHMSCNLSGTMGMMEMISRDFDDMQIAVIDSKSVSIGVGMLVYAAARFIAQGLSFEEIKSRLNSVKDNVKVFFCIPVLDYLRKGGRIGLVAATIGSIMDLKPIISVNSDGRYYSAGKVRGRKKSLEKLQEIAMDFIKDHKVNVAVYHGGALEDATGIKEIISKLPNIQEILFGQISTTMAIHTGPGLVGIAIEVL